MSEGPVEEAARLFAENERLESRIAELEKDNAALKERNDSVWRSYEETAKELALVSAGGYQLGWDRATAKMESNRGEEIASGWVMQFEVKNYGIGDSITVFRDGIDEDKDIPVTIYKKGA